MLKFQVDLRSAMSAISLSGMVSNRRSPAARAVSGVLLRKTGHA